MKKCKPQVIMAAKWCEYGIYWNVILILFAYLILHWLKVKRYGGALRNRKHFDRKMFLCWYSGSALPCIISISIIFIWNLWIQCWINDIVCHYFTSIAVQDNIHSLKDIRGTNIIKRPIFKLFVSFSLDIFFFDKAYTKFDQT